MANVEVSKLIIDGYEHLNTNVMGFNLRYGKASLVVAVPTNLEITQELYNLLQRREATVVIYRMTKEFEILYAEVSRCEVVDAVDQDTRKEIEFKVLASSIKTPEELKAMQTQSTGEGEGTGEGEENKQASGEKEQTPGSGKEKTSGKKKTVNKGKTPKNPPKTK